jgi:hypothetical protein
MQLRFGERTRLACCSRRPAENLVRTDESLNSELLLRANLAGGTAALPNFCGPILKHSFATAFYSYSAETLLASRPGVQPLRSC